jgi:hypothetical protein
MEELGLLYNYQQSWNPKQAITLKHLIAYNNLRTYINPKGMIGMPIIDCHVWDHAYGHDKELALMMKMRKHCFYKELWNNLFKLWKLKFVSMVTIGWAMQKIYHERGSLGMNAHLWTIFFLHQCMVGNFWGVSIRQINIFMKVIQCHRLKINAEKGFLNMFVSLD